MKGSCLCGIVEWECLQDQAQAFFCHCSICRRHHGAIGSILFASMSDQMVNNLHEVQWISWSDRGARGSCRHCGSKLFWQEAATSELYPVAGSVIDKTGIVSGCHIFTASKGDYYDINDGLPCYAEGMRDAHPTTVVPKKVSPGSRAEARTGRCLCGKVKFALNGIIRPVVYCHCGQCHRQHGFYPGYTAVKIDKIDLDGDSHVKWFASSATAGRGFCNECSSLLFWSSQNERFLSVAAGGLDGPTGLNESHHIYVTDKPSYYVLNDGLAQYPGTSPVNAAF